MLRISIHGLQKVALHNSWFKIIFISFLGLVHPQSEKVNTLLASAFLPLSQVSDWPPLANKAYK